MHRGDPSSHATCVTMVPTACGMIDLNAMHIEAVLLLKLLLCRMLCHDHNVSLSFHSLCPRMQTRATHYKQFRPSYFARDVDSGDALLTTNICQIASEATQMTHCKVESITPTHRLTYCTISLLKDCASQKAAAACKVCCTRSTSILHGRNVEV